MQVCVDGQTIADVIRLDRHSGGQDGQRRDRDRAVAQRACWNSASLGSRMRWSHQPAHPYGARQARRPAPAHRRVPAGRPERRRQDRDGATLADVLYGGEHNMVTINMSEYQEAHTVSGLKGSPPGYVGYGEGGVLTEAVRRKPYCVVLLDEVEKAHQDVMELFYQVFDKGMLEDGEGREIDFKNTVIMMTSNVGTDTIMKLCADPETRPEPEALVEALRPDLLKSFKPAFLGRIDRGPLLSDFRRCHAPDHPAAARSHPHAGCWKTIARSSPTTKPWSPASPSAAPKSKAGRATWITF